MKILVSGGFDTADAQLAERVAGFAEALGPVIADNGHVLLNGCWTELDRLLIDAMHRRLLATGAPDVERRIVSYVLDGLQPVHMAGTILRSRLSDWDIANATFYIP